MCIMFHTTLLWGDGLFVTQLSEMGGSIPFTFTFQSPNIVMLLNLKNTLNAS